MQAPEPHGEISLVVGTNGAGSQEAKIVAHLLDDAPSGAPKARIDADDANRFCHAAKLADVTAMYDQPRAKAVRNRVICSSTGFMSDRLDVL